MATENTRPRPWWRRPSVWVRIALVPVIVLLLALILSHVGS